jgi:DNA-binding MarR family transcriptional regulator
MMKYHDDMAQPDREIALLDQVLEVAVLVNQDMDSSLGERGLTPARTHLLWELLHRGPSTQTDLATALGVSPRNVTGLVDGLQETGFVTREPHPTDRRAALVTLTDHGSKVMAQMQVEHEEFARLLFGDLTARQISSLARGLGHVLDRLRKLAQEGESP